MRIYDTVATHRLEEKARALGHELEIRVIEPREDAFYFVTAVEGRALKTPAPLGWTDEHAIETLRRGTWAGRTDTF